MCLRHSTRSSPFHREYLALKHSHSRFPSPSGFPIGKTTLNPWLHLDIFSLDQSIERPGDSGVVSGGAWGVRHEKSGKIETFQKLNMKLMEHEPLNSNKQSDLKHEEMTFQKHRINIRIWRIIQQLFSVVSNQQLIVTLVMG